MNSGRAGLVFACTVLLAAAHIVWAAGVLPDEVASHFDGKGHADGWSSRGEFLTGYAFTILVMAATFGGLAWLLPRLPASAINLPDKDYWLAPERSALARRKLTDWLLLTGAGTNLFLIGVFHLSVRANTGDAEPRLGPAFGIMLTLFLVGMAGAVIALFLGFRRPRGPRP